MPTDQVVYDERELLADHVLAEPLIADGVRCHGGFDEDGTYVSPRTLHRVPAIEAWEAKRVADFGTPVVDIGLDRWPEQFPNVAQTKLLLRNGVPGPTIATLTRVGTVEGFGAFLRLMPIPDWRRVFFEDISGTAIDHLGRGLFEAHASDEAGSGDVAGHDTMWFAARDIAFDRPVTENEREAMLERMGLLQPGGAPGPLAQPERILPDDIDPMVEGVVSRMINLLFIEISAFHTFAWAEDVLADDDLVAGSGEAARLVSYIRADETPHVDYLRTTLSEMRDRTWIGASGSTYPGDEMIRRLWDAGLAASSGPRRADFLALMLREIRGSLAGRVDADDLLDEVLDLGAVRLGPDGSLVDTSDPRVADDG